MHFTLNPSFRLVLLNGLKTSSSSLVGEERVLVAVPKKGRLYEPVLKLLNSSGFEHVRKERLDIAECTRIPVTLIFLPAADIASYVGAGDVDLGITGEVRR